MPGATDETKYLRRLNRELRSILGRGSPKKFNWELFATRADVRLVTWKGFSIPHSGVAATAAVTINGWQYWVVAILQPGAEEEKLIGCLPVLGLLGILLMGLVPKQLVFVLFNDDPRQLKNPFGPHSRHPLRWFKNRKELQRHLAQ